MFNFFKKKEKDSSQKSIEIQEDFSNIDSIESYFHNETGITYKDQKSILLNKVRLFCRQREIYSFKELLQSVESNFKLKQELINHLTTNETYFYREVKQIMELVQLVQQSDTKVSILCAQSATGEEPYSIVLALLDAGVSREKFNVLGLDINSDAIEKSKEAIYTEKNLRCLSEDIISKYFSKQESLYSLNENIKSLVSFEVLNIFDASFEKIGKFDFVFSRNMLIYFDKETKLEAKHILENVRKNDRYDVFFGHADLF